MRAASFCNAVEGRLFMKVIDAKTLASAIDHTILKADATKQQLVDCCRQAREYGFASVCVNPFYVPLVAAELANTGVRVCAVIGFPLGANNSEVKSFEAAAAVKAGAEEIDMVINIGALKGGNYDYVENEISSVVKASGKAIVKVIIETCYLTQEEKTKACILAVKAGAKFVKTSTGLGVAGATVEDVILMRAVVGVEIGVKAAGGIRSLKDALDMLGAGADRIGTSAGVKIIGELE